MGNSDVCSEALNVMWEGAHTIHRDISTGNILFDSANSRLGDLEYVVFYDDEPSSLHNVKTVSLIILSLIELIPWNREPCNSWPSKLPMVHNSFDQVLPQKMYFWLQQMTSLLLALSLCLLSDIVPSMI